MYVWCVCEFRRKKKKKCLWVFFRCRVVSAQQLRTWQPVSQNSAFFHSFPFFFFLFFPFAVSYTEDASATQSDVVVFFAGYNCLLQDSQVWAGNVVSARMNARHVFATAGPRDSAYIARELNTRGLAARIQELVSSSSRVTVLAHSSGAFPAFALLQQLSPTLRNVHLYCLDSGIAGATDSLLRRLASIVPVVAKDTKTGLESRLTFAMQQLAARKDPRTGRRFTKTHLCVQSADQMRRTQGLQLHARRCHQPHSFQLECL